MAAALAVGLVTIGDAKADSALKPPISTLGWLLGSWTCQQTDWDTGPRSGHATIRYTANPNGKTIDYRLRAGGAGSVGRITWNDDTSHYLDKSSETNDAGGEQGGLIASKAEVTANRMVFHGVFLSHGGAWRARVTTDRKTADEFTETSDQLLSDGTWKTIAVAACHRTSLTPI